MFDPRDGFFPRELLESDVPRSPYLRAPQRKNRNARWLLLALALLVGAGAYVLVNLQSFTGRAPANASTPAAPAKSSATAAGSIAPVASPKAAAAVIAPATLPAAQPPEVAKAPAYAPPTRAAGEVRSAEPAAGSPKSVVTHTKSAAVAASAGAAEAAQEPAAPPRAAVPATVAPPRNETRTNPPQPACTAALAALGLCVQTTKGENN